MVLTCEPLASAAWWLLRTAHCGPWTTGGCWRCKPSKMDAENTRDKEGPDACEAWRTSAEARRRAHTRGAFEHCCAAWSGENASAVRGRTTPSRSGYRCRRHCSKLRLRDSRKSKHVLPRPATSDATHRHGPGGPGATLSVIFQTYIGDGVTRSLQRREDNCRRQDDTRHPGEVRAGGRGAERPGSAQSSKPLWNHSNRRGQIDKRSPHPS